METLKFVIIACYLVAMFLSISGITIVILAGKKRKSKLNTGLRYFMIGLFIMSIYDMIIYYTDYSIGSLENTVVLRIGMSIMAILFFLWMNLQQMIMRSEEYPTFHKGAMVFIGIYAVFWLVTSVIVPLETFYTLRWILLTTDIVLLLILLTGSVVYMSKAIVNHQKENFIYMVLVTAMLVWNYASYFWGEGSVYWGNSRFIREPLDLTIIFWFIVNIANIYFIYKVDFSDAYKEEENKGHSIEKRLDDVALEYDLTTRERDLVKLIYEGKSNAEIAELLFISQSTVKTHVYNIFKKLKIKNRGGINNIINQTEESEA